MALLCKACYPKNREDPAQAWFSPVIFNSSDMVFVTSGTQLPFDRFIQCIDELAPMFPSETFIVQSIYRPAIKSSNVKMLSRVSPEEFTTIMNDASVIISHAGVGSIISAARSGKQLIVFPRMGKLKEHRNNHQVATCEAMQKQFALNVANNTSELKELLEKHYSGQLPSLPSISSSASDSLIQSISDFIRPVPSFSIA